MEPLKWHKRQERNVELPGVESRAFTLPCQCYLTYCMRFLLETCTQIYEYVFLTVYLVVCASREYHDIKTVNKKAYTEAIQAVINVTSAIQAVINATSAIQAVIKATSAIQAVINATSTIQAVINATSAIQAVINATSAIQAVINATSAIQAVITAISGDYQVTVTVQLKYCCYPPFG